MLNIYTCRTLFDGYEPLMKRLEANRKAKIFASHIFVVPDRFTMQCEKDIFEYLNIDSTFDIRVLTLSRFAGELIGAAKGVLSKQASTMIIQRLLLKNKSNLKCFNKTKLNYSFASEIFDTINQLKSSKVSPEEMTLEGEDYLAIKMADIRLIYEAYERYLEDNGLIDSADKFTLFERYLPNAKNLKNTAIYISHFDSFTKQGYSIVKKLILHAGQVNIAVPKSNGEVNSHIYLNDMYDNIKEIAISENIDFAEFEVNSKLKDDFEHIKNNLFAYKPRQAFLKERDIELACYDTFLTECDFVAKNIKKLINDGARQRDICVMCPALVTNKDTIKKVFDEYELNSFFDISTSLTGQVLDKFFDEIFAIKVKYYKTEDIVSLLHDPVLGIDENYVFETENYLKSMQIAGKSLFRDNEKLNALRKALKPIIDFVQGLNAKGNYKYYVESFEKLFETLEVEKRLEVIADKYQKNGYLKQAKIVEQLYQKTANIFSIVKDIFDDIECDIYEFYDVVKSGFDSTSVSTTPVSVDGIFVGDASKSIIGRPKYLFVMGARDGDLPYTLSDCGMITDKEIAKMANLYKLEPTVNVINLRERFKLFNLLLMAKNKLFVSYSRGKNNALAAGFFTSLQNMFLELGRNGRQNIEVLDADYNYLSFCEKLGGRKSAGKILAERLRNIEDGILYSAPQETGALFDAIAKDTPYIEDYKNLTDYKKCSSLKTNVFFGKGTISVSEIERYYSCPFKHFVDYGLKLQENKVISFDNIEVGNFLHKVAELFVKENMTKLPFSDDFKTEVDRIFDKVLLLDEFSTIKENDSSTLSLISIKKEAQRMCEAINYQIKKSNFRPILTEARFDDNGAIKGLEITVGDKTLKIVGAIDRVDTCRDYFRIIDYKTGRCDSSLKELYYGKKLQLYVYQAVAQNSLKLKPAGAYYFPVKNSFVADGGNKFEIYRLKGYTESSESVLKDTDCDFENNTTSDIINAMRKKDMSLKASSEVLDEEGILALASYALAMLSLGVKEILEGNIAPSPFVIDGKSACEFCKYKAICRYDESIGDKSRQGSGSVDIDTLKESLSGRD